MVTGHYSDYWESVSHITRSSDLCMTTRSQQITNNCIHERRSQKCVGTHPRVEASKAQSGVGFVERCCLSSRLWGLRERRELPHLGPTAANAFSAYSRA